MPRPESKYHLALLLWLQKQKLCSEKFQPSTFLVLVGTQLDSIFFSSVDLTELSYSCSLFSVRFYEDLDPRNILNVFPELRTYGLFSSFFFSP